MTAPNSFNPIENQSNPTQLSSPRKSPNQRPTLQLPIYIFPHHSRSGYRSINWSTFNHLTVTRNIFTSAWLLRYQTPPSILTPPHSSEVQSPRSIDWRWTHYQLIPTDNNSPTKTNRLVLQPLLWTALVRSSFNFPAVLVLVLDPSPGAISVVTGSWSVTRRSPVLSVECLIPIVPTSTERHPLTGIAATLTT